jgi:hypothetical protein
LVGNTVLAVIAVLGISTASASALDSNVTMTSSMSTDALWKKVGDFYGIAAWHPAIEKCVLSADGKQRTLSLKGGGTVVEALENWDDANRSYTYTILSGPLPVANYHSTIGVADDPKGSASKWKAHMMPRALPTPTLKRQWTASTRPVPRCSRVAQELVAIGGRTFSVR